MKKSSYEIDMCNGPILGKVLRFSIPLMLSGILQLLFNAADIVVVGRFSGKEAMAAVGATSALINLLINIFVGLSVGANVAVARYYGAKREKDVSKTVLDQAVLYMRIYFLGMPVLMFYNFGSAILRAVGDTKRPLYFLFTAGVINAVLNVVFVVKLGMSVDGVGWATVISETISALLVARTLMRSEGPLRLHLKLLKIHRKHLLQIIKVGLPAGVQGAIFSVSNVLIQSSVNSFGSVAMAGNTAGANIEGFVYTAMNAVYQTNLSFTSQNLGARKYGRINRILLICQGVVMAVGMLLGFGALAAGNVLLQIYSSDPEVIRYGLLRMSIICSTYFTCGMMDCMVGSLRGMGYSVFPMIVSLVGACGLRIVWIFTIFAAWPTLTVLYLSYPVSWVITTAAHVVTFLKKIRRRYPKEDV